MIKINLLEVEKERRAKGPAPAAGAPTSLIALIAIGGSLAAFVLYYFSIENRIKDLQQEIEVKKVKKKELEPYIQKVEELDRRRSDLAKKNRAIEELRSQRTIPVHILDEVSRALPDYLWLTNLQVQGEQLNIDGQTIQEQAIPTFMKRLDDSEFIGTCSLIETQQENPGAQGTVATRFKISAPITNPFKPKVEPKKG
jgi:type IV pilus assembly protein PilN